MSICRGKFEQVVELDALKSTPTMYLSTFGCDIAFKNSRVLDYCIGLGLEFFGWHVVGRAR